MNIKNQIYDKVETLPTDELRSLQLDRFRQLIKHVAHVPFYKKAFADAAISPDSIKHIDDIAKIPFTTKADLRDAYPLNFLAVPREQIVRFHGSSGTTGKPTFVAYTKDDLDLWANLCARFLVAGGLKPHHTAHVAFGYGMFTGAFGLHQGIEKVGAAVVPAGAGNTERHIMLMRDLKADALICTPSYAVNIAEVLHKLNLTASDLPISLGHFGAEPWTEDMRQHIEKDLDITAFNNYGLSEVVGPGVSGECVYRSGMHMQEDHFFIECLDPDTLKPVPPGSPGELVITTLTRQGTPVIRYRTRDIASLDTSPCPCGRTTVRMSRVIGRSDDMLIIRGVNVFPSQIEEALLSVEGTAPHYLIEVDRPGTMDQVTVKVEIRPQDFSDEMREMQKLHDQIDRKIQAITSIRMNVELVGPNTIARSVGKAQRVIDHRRTKGLI